MVKPFLLSLVPLIRQPFGLPPSPEGKAKRPVPIKNPLAAAAQEGPRVVQTHPCFPPFNKQ